jgi:hypothetical protein
LALVITIVGVEAIDSISVANRAAAQTSSTMMLSAFGVSGGATPRRWRGTPPQPAPAPNPLPINS